MQKLPKAIRQLIEKFERLPGIGPKSAQRLVFYLLHHPEYELQDFANKLLALKKETVLCSRCHLVAEHDPCEICDDDGRDETILCVVEQPLDALAIERAGSFSGRYHVLHGAISPLQNIGPEQLFLHDITQRLTNITELIIATNLTMEGEATALYLVELIKQQQQKWPQLHISRIGHGLPIGADIEYADGVTLTRALEGRRTLSTDIPA